LKTAAFSLHTVENTIKHT